MLSKRLGFQEWDKLLKTRPSLQKCFVLKLKLKWYWTFKDFLLKIILFKDNSEKTHSM